MRRDVHTHLERGPYTIEWAEKFIDQAEKTGLKELWILEHTHRFEEFIELYAPLKQYGDFQRDWVAHKGSQKLADYLDLVETMRKRKYPVSVKWGLEVCYFPGTEQIVQDKIKPLPLDFLVGAVHWVDGFGFDQEKSMWEGVGVEQTYTRYYEIMKQLIRSDLFDGLAHPDSIKCFGYLPKEDFGKTYQEVAELLNEHHMYTEESTGLFNNYGYWEKGLNSQMRKIFRDNQVRLETASDAHLPENVGKI